MAGLKKQNRDGFIHHLCWPKGKTKHLSHKVLYLTSDTPVLCLSFSSSWCEQAIFAQHVALREWHEGTWILAWTEVRNLFLPWHCSNKLSVKFYSHQGKKKCSLCDGGCSRSLGSPFAFLTGELLELPESPVVRGIVFSTSSHRMGIAKNSLSALHLTFSLIFWTAVPTCKLEIASVKCMSVSAPALNLWGNTTGNSCRWLGQSG